MKLNVLKSMIALSVMGLLFSCSLDNNKKKINCVNDTIVTKTIVEFVPEGKKIYLMDVSGSMQGKGTIETSDVFNSTKEHLAKSLNKISDSCEVVIIPFSSTPLTEKRFNSFDEANKIQALESLTIDEGNTNIYSAFNKALKEFDTTKNNVLFFITDGYHNEYVSNEVLYETLKSFPSKKEAKYSNLYYYITSPSCRDMEICRIFEENEKMEVIESLIFSKEKCDTSIIYARMSDESISDKDHFNVLKWILIILAILVLIAISLLKAYIIIPRLPNLFLGTVDTLGRFIGSLVNILDRLPKIIKELLFKLLPSKMKKACDDYWDKIKNKNNRNWDTDKNFMRPRNLNEIPKSFNPQNLPWKEILPKYNINPQKGIRINKNGEIDWNNLSKCTVEKKGLYNKYKDKFQDRGGGNNIQDEIGKIMAKKMNLPIEQFWKYKSDNGLVIHERPNLKTFNLVPKEIHDNIAHGGGISVGGIAKNLLGGSGICLIDALIVILTLLCFIGCLVLFFLFINYIL